MLPTQVIYTVNADIGLLNAIFNGVAMVCKQTAMIWGFAMLAATWRIVSTITAGAIKSAAGSQAGAGMVSDSMSAITPFLLAILITNPSLKTDVTVESSMNGTVTSISNVPFVLSVVPATASVLSQQIGGVIETAMQGTGTDYASISASGAGFINPLKTLLTSRTAMLKLGGIDSQIKSVISSCLGSDAGVDYAAISDKVLHAGNSGATATESLDVFDAAAGAPTAIGALLYQASQNPTGIVSDFAVGGSSITSCHDAAVAVAANINTALYSPEFARVVQGAVNSDDQPNTGGNYSISQVTKQYRAVRTANTVSMTLAGGVAQANAEAINLLFSEMVKNDLDCLKADGANKSTCLAMAVQGNEIERNNIQSAANGVEGLLYAGQFSNYVTALIIGLGPVIVLFMMFSGVDSGKNMRVAVHMIVWPLLIMNVGAELINGMIYNTVANFMTTIAQKGYISQATSSEVYKAFSLQVGTASHLMATLPILMTTIFALGESAALVSISNSMGSNSTKESEAANPAAVNSAPLVSNSSIANAQQTTGGASLALTGALAAASTDVKYGAMANEASHNLSQSIAQQRTISEGTKDLHEWQKAFATGNYSQWGLTKSQGESIKAHYERNLQAAEREAAGTSVNANKNNANTSSTKLGGGISLGKGGLSGGVSVGGETNTSALDVLQKSEATDHQKSATQSNALSKALSEEASKSGFKTHGGDARHSVQQSMMTQKDFSNTLSKTTGVTESSNALARRNSEFVAYSAKIGAAEYITQLNHNSEFSAFQNNEGHAFDRISGIDKYKDQARSQMSAGEVTEIINNNDAREALVRNRAAASLANDEMATPEDRIAAEQYLIGSANAMQHLRFVQPRDTTPLNVKVDDPKNKTGVNPHALVAVAPGPRSESSAHTAKPRKTGGKVKSTSAHSASAHPAIDSVDQQLTAGHILKTGIVNDVATDTHNATKDVKKAEDHANAVGLGKGGDGTIVRTGKNVASNAGVPGYRTE